MRIPARLVVGYGSGDHDGLTGTFTVRAHDAHAWVEGALREHGGGCLSTRRLGSVASRWRRRQRAGSCLMSSLPNLALRSLGSLGGQLGGAASAAVVVLAALAAFSLVSRRRRALPLAELRACAAAQRWLGRAGLPVRAPATTPVEHLALLARVDAVAAGRLEPLVESVQRRLFAGLPAAARPSLLPLLRRMAARRMGIVR